MSKSPYSGSPLYMTTREFADLIIDVLDEQNYFKKDAVAHPYDICVSFTTIAETIGKTMEWAISQESLERKKQAVMQPKNLKKSEEDSEEISDDEVGYSEWRTNEGYV